MAAHKTRLTYNDVVATLPTLAPDEQISLLEVLSSVLKKQSCRVFKSIVYVNLRDWALRCGQSLIQRIISARNVIHGIKQTFER